MLKYCTLKAYVTFQGYCTMHTNNSLKQMMKNVNIKLKNTYIANGGEVCIEKYVKMSSNDEFYERI